MLRLWTSAVLLTVAMAYGAVALNAQADAEWRATIADAGHAGFDR